MGKFLEEAQFSTFLGCRPYPQFGPLTPSYFFGEGRQNWAVAPTKLKGGATKKFWNVAPVKFKGGATKIFWNVAPIHLEGGAPATPFLSLLPPLPVPAPVLLWLAELVLINHPSLYPIFIVREWPWSKISEATNRKSVSLIGKNFDQWE